MRAELRRIASTLTLGGALGGIAFLTYALSRLHAFERRPVGRSAVCPPITLLKPVHGLEFELEANLRSFCAQDYPEYQVVLGVLDPNDPALPVLLGLAAEFGPRVEVAIGDGVARYRNPKVATLAPMLPLARHEILVVADSDMQVGPDYLDAIAAAFDDPAVGAATCIYRGAPANDGLADALGAMAITEQFAPSALVATSVEPMSYCFGGTMAVRRSVFDAFGGLEALGAQLADDAAMGRFTADLGYRVVLADYAAATVVDEPNLRTLLAHELRWARTVRSVRPGGYAGLILTYPLPLAMLHFVLGRNRPLAHVVLGAAAGIRLAIHLASHRILRAPKRPPYALVPLRDVLGLAVWIAGLRGDEVRWRGRPIQIAPDGEIEPEPTSRS